METNITRLQLEVVRAQARLARVIKEEVENGKKAEKCLAGVFFENVLLINDNAHHSASIVLHVDAPEIDELFRPSIELLKAQKENLQSQIDEIEKQIKNAKQ